MTTNRLRKIRDELYVKNNHCKYCGIIMAHKSRLRNRAKNLCTINHFYSKLNPLRSIADQYLEICCYKCNQRLAHLDHIVFEKFPINYRRFPILFIFLLVVYRNNPKKAYILIGKIHLKLKLIKKGLNKSLY